MNTNHIKLYLKHDIKHNQNLKTRLLETET